MSKYESFLELVQTRRSVRRFADRPVPRADLLRVLEAARWAPSNHNRQPWRFLVLEEPQQIHSLAELVNQDLADKLQSLPPAASAYATEFARYATFFASAPVLIAALHKQPVSLSATLLEGVREPTLVSGEPLSVAMAVQNLLLAAQTLGLGTCVLTAPLVARATVEQALKVPPGHDLTCLVAVGYPAESPTPPRRKSLEQIAELMHDSRKPENANE